MRKPSIRDFYRRGNTIAQMGEETMMPVGQPIYLTKDSGASSSVGETVVIKPSVSAMNDIVGDLDMNDVIKQFEEQSMVSDHGDAMLATQDIIQKAADSIPPVTINKQPIPTWAVALAVLLLLRR